MVVARGALRVAWLAALCAVLASCGMTDERQGRDWVKRVVLETPRLAQLLFALPAPPASTYREDQRYPDWLREVTFVAFAWTQVRRGEYRGRATVDVAPGASLARPPTQPAGPLPARVRAEITVDFTVHTTPPPLFFLPRGKSLVPVAWTLHSVDGRRVEETGRFVDYREQAPSE